jgi:hypothetical protein
MAVPADLSRCGFRADVARRFVAGELLALVPTVPHPLAGRPFSFFVVRCDPSPDGGYDLAGAFAPLLSDDDVGRLAWA